MGGTYVHVTEGNFPADRNVPVLPLIVFIGSQHTHQEHGEIMLGMLKSFFLAGLPR